MSVWNMKSRLTHNLLRNADTSCLGGGVGTDRGVGDDTGLDKVEAGRLREGGGGGALLAMTWKSEEEEEVRM
jgi:hypothetical protein